MLTAASLRTRYAGRPLLMRRESALEIAHQLRAMDAQVLERPGRVSALLRALGMRRRQDANAVRVRAMEDDYDGPPPVPFEERAAYAPLYVGEVEDVGYCWSLKSGVALMQCDTPLLERGDDFCGVHHGYDTLLTGLQDAAADERVKAMFLRLDCPGGPVAGGLPTLAAWMRANRAAAGGKPIWVYADMAASAAYWIASGGDRVVAPNVGIVGSIGAVLVHEDWSGALEKAGVQVEAIQFGTAKTDGAWWAALSPTARADLQAEIDQCGRNFVADVTLGRPQLTEAALLETQARCYMGEHDEPERSGLALGFVDEIMGEADAFGALAAQVSTPGKTISTPAAGGGRTATASEKDKPMADTAQPKPAANEAPTGDDTKDAPANPATVAGGDGDDAIEGDEAEAQAIAASAEAKAHPALALSAIQSGMSLAQFQAAAGAAPAPRETALAVVLADNPRLGPDSKPEGQAAAPKLASAAETFSRNVAKGLEARKRR